MNPQYSLSARKRARLLHAAAIVAALALTGCVSVPTAGPVEPGAMPSGSSSARVQIEPAPPVPDASPSLVVEGFLHAMSNSVGDYAIARSYLSEAARDAWRPRRGVLVYDDSYPVTVSEDSVVLEAPLEGELGPDGSFTHVFKTYRIDFGLVKDQTGQWRITNPPNGVLISQYLFERFYEQYNLYFFEPSYQTLVPDPIFVERSSQPATSLLGALLKGPSQWLRPAVASAFPGETTASLATPVGNGVVDVFLNGSLANLNGTQRSRMAAQIVWTLRQVREVPGVRLFLNGQNYRVPEQNADGVIAMDAYGGVDPVSVGSDELYVANADGLSIVLSDDAEARTERVGGSCAEVFEPISSFTVTPASGPARRLAAVTSGRLVTCGLAPGSELATASAIGGDILRPQYSRFGELWAMTNQPSGSSLYRVSQAKTDSLDNATIADSQVRAFRISPDGTRMAVIRRMEGKWQLGLLRIERGERLAVSGWRPIVLSTSGDPAPRVPLDVGWVDATRLMVLAAEPGGQTEAEPYLVNQDGTELSQIGPGDWAPKSLATFPQTAGHKAVVVSTKGSLWRYRDDYRWPFLLDEVQAASYPG